MSKHRRHKNQNKLQHTETVEREDLVKCPFCGKRYSWMPPAPGTRPSLYIAIGDQERGSWTLAPCREDFELMEWEEFLGFVCADRQCVVRAFLVWQQWDKRQELAKSIAPPEAFMRYFLSLSDEGKKNLSLDVRAAAGYGYDDEDDSPPAQVAAPDNAIVQNPDPDQGNIFPNQKPE